MYKEHPKGGKSSLFLACVLVFWFVGSDFYWGPAKNNFFATIPRVEMKCNGSTMAFQTQCFQLALFNFVDNQAHHKCAELEPRRKQLQSPVCCQQQTDVNCCVFHAFQTRPAKTRARLLHWQRLAKYINQCSQSMIIAMNEQRPLKVRIKQFKL